MDTQHDCVWICALDGLHVSTEQEQVTVVLAWQREAQVGGSIQNACQNVQISCGIIGMMSRREKLQEWQLWVVVSIAGYVYSDTGITRWYQQIKLQTYLSPRLVHVYVDFCGGGNYLLYMLIFSIHLTNKLSKSAPCSCCWDDLKMTLCSIHFQCH